MSYYKREYLKSFEWEFYVVAMILLFVLCFIRSCTSESTWNNGICSYCGGHYKFQQAIGHLYFTDYMYTCDKCGRSIEIGKHYMEVQDEIAKQ